MWLTGVSILLPRAQQTFQVPDEHIGIMSSCFFAGMMGGATVWGIAADRMGRKMPFFMCPLLAAVCAYAVALAPSFPFLCILLFPLGFNAAGSIPVDSSLLAEFLPPANKYWVTLLALFYCGGDVTSSSTAWILLPSTSCDPTDEINCPPGQNRGWRYFFTILASIQLLFFIIRILAFRQRETPSYLLSNGKREEAIEVLWNIARRNGHSREDSAKLGIDRLTLNPPTGTPEMRRRGRKMTKAGGKSGDFTKLDGEDDLESSIHSSSAASSSSASSSRSSSKSSLGKPGRSYGTRGTKRTGREKEEEEGKRGTRTVARLFEGRVAAMTSLIVWSQWFLMSFGYMLYASFLPKLLEKRQSSGDAQGDESLANSYRDLFIYAICGFPASFIARYAVNSRLGRKGTLTAFMWSSATLLLGFTVVKSPIGSIIIIGIVNITSTVAWAGLSTYAAEVFSVQVRGTGTGIASAMQRVAGIVGPVVTGLLMKANPNFPLWGASCILGLAGLCGILLPIETKPRTRSSSSS